MGDERRPVINKRKITREVSKLGRVLSSKISRGLSRGISQKIKEEEEEEEVNGDDDLVSPEIKLEGGIGLSVYRKIFSFTTIGTCGLVIFLITCIINGILQILPAYFISVWVDLSFED